MGEDKSLLPFERFETLIEYQVDKYSKIFETIYISTKTDKYSFLKDRYNIEFIFDENKEFSPMIALSSVFEKIESEYMFITTVDVPFINDQVIKKLFESIKDNEIAIAVNNKKIHNLCGVFSQKVKKRVDLLL
jgi:molybdopterin-guanine dinucleotide biosynthesis protein A